MKVLIIGGTGLISTPLTRILLERGHELTLFNRGVTDARIPDGATIVNGDRKDYPAFVKHMQSLPAFDCVIDMICFTPDDAQSLVDAFTGRCGHMIVCSTVDVYARPTPRFPIHESAPRGGVSNYGVNKARCEENLLAVDETSTFPVTIIRPAQTYGEGGALIHSLGWSTSYIDRLRKGKPIIVHGDGKSLWVACHIDDVATAFANAVGRPQTFGNCYNATGEEWMTWDAYNRTVAEAIEVPLPRLVHIPTDLLCQADERAMICKFNFQFDNIFDTTAARRDLGFAYTIPFLEGARRTIAWLDANGRIENSDEDERYDAIISAWDRLGNDLLADVHKRT